jgi:hypothetical protein
MQDDQTARDAARLLVAFSTNHDEARTASPHGLDRPFTRTGPTRSRRDSIGSAATTR